MEKIQGRCGERTCTVPSPGTIILTSSHVHSPETQMPSFGVLWRLHYIDIIDEIIGHWKLGVGEGKFSTFKSHTLFPWQPASNLRYFLKSPHWHKPRCGWGLLRISTHLYCSYPLRKFQEFQELCTRNTDKDQIYLTSKSQYHRDSTRQ